MAVVHNRTSPGSRRTCRLHPLPRRTPLDLRPHPLRSTGSPHAAPPPAMGAGYPPPPSPAPPDPCTTRPWRWLLPSPGIPAPPAMKGSSSSGRALQHRQPLSYSCCSTATPPSDGRPWHADMPCRRKSFSLYLEFLTPDLFSVSSNWLSPLSFLDFTLLFPLQLFVTFLPGLLPHFWLVKHAIVLRFNPNQTWVGLAREHDSPSATFRCSHFLGARSPSLSSACCRERWPWPPDAEVPPAKDPPASRPPPRHLHLAGDLHQVPSSAFAILRPPPRSSAARVLQPTCASSRGEELPATSLSGDGKPAG